MRPQYSTQIEFYNLSEGSEFGIKIIDAITSKKNELGIKFEVVELHYLGIGNIPGTSNFALNNISTVLKYHSLNKKYKLKKKNKKQNT